MRSSTTSMGQDSRPLGRRQLPIGWTFAAPQGHIDHDSIRSENRSAMDDCLREESPDGSATKRSSTLDPACFERARFGA